MPKQHDTINKVFRNTAAKVTGENVPGSNMPRRRYAQTQIAHFSGGLPDTNAGIRGLQNQSIRLGQSMAGGTNITSPNFYTPFTTPSAFQIPNNRKEVYLWAQWWYDNEPVVAAGIEFYTDFPLSGFELECGNGYVKDYFEELVKKLNFPKWLPLISQEYHLRGDVFAMMSIDCEHCQGLNINEDGEKCKHEGATWKSLTILNPDTVESSGFFLDQEPQYYMMPDEGMVRVVQEKTPKELYERIPEEIRKKILQRAPIYLEPISIYHMKRGAAPWQPYGTSMVRRLFPTLAYKDKLRQAQWLVAERHIIPIKIVTIGSDDRPASDEDIQSVQEELTNVANDPLLTLVTHHNFKLDYVGTAGKVLQLTNEFDLINQDLFDGLMLNKLIINGEGPAYNSAQVGLLTMSKRLERFRGEVSHFIEEIIFKQIAIWNGFTVEGKRGQEEYIYPTIKWADLELRDNSNKLQVMQSAQQAGILSAQTFLETLGIDYDQEVERLRFENTAGFISSPDSNTGAMGGMDGGADMGGMGGGGLADILGGMGGGGGEAPAGGPEMPGGEMGGAPAPEAGAPMPTASRGSMEQYRFASNLVNQIYKERRAPHDEKMNIRVANKQIKSQIHKEFLESFPVVTGRGKLGMLPEEPSIIVETEWFVPFDGGPFSMKYNSQLNKFAKKEPQAPKMLFSKLEQNLYNLILGINIPFPFYAQYQAGPGLQYQLDGAFPTIKIGVEADSKTFHSSPEKIVSDKQRDMALAAQGWTILRFTEEEIQEQPQDVVNVLITVINRKSSGNSSGENTI